MNKLALLPLLILPACAPGENARLAQAALAHDQAACTERGNQPGTDAYLRCMRKLGHRDGYLLSKTDDNQLAFTLPNEGPLPRELGQTGTPNIVPPSLQRPR